MSTRAPQLAELIAAAIEHRLSQLHVCMPGVVQSYDAAKQTCDVQPGIKNVIECGDGEKQLTFPLIPNVPVAFPRAGQWFLHFPLSPGDSVVLVFAQRSLDEWRAKGGTDVDPLDLRKHDLSDAIAIPGSVYPDGSALTVPTDHLAIGNQSGSTIHVNADGTISIGSATPLDSVATALKVNTQLQQLATALGAWVPVPSDGGAALKVILTTLLATGWPANVASAKVKVDP